MVIHGLDARGRKIRSKRIKGEYIKHTACGADAAHIVFESDDEIVFVGSDLPVTCPACIDVLDEEFAVEYERKMTKLVKKLKRAGEFEDFDWDDFDLVSNAVWAA